MVFHPYVPLCIYTISMRIKLCFYQQQFYIKMFRSSAFVLQNSLDWSWKLLFEVDLYRSSHAGLWSCWFVFICGEQCLETRLHGCTQWMEGFMHRLVKSDFQILYDLMRIYTSTTMRQISTFDLQKVFLHVDPVCRVLTSMYTSKMFILLTKVQQLCTVYSWPCLSCAVTSSWPCFDSLQL